MKVNENAKEVPSHWGLAVRILPLMHLQWPGKLWYNCWPPCSFKLPLPFKLLYSWAYCAEKRNTILELIILAHELFWMVWSRWVRTGEFIHWKNIWLIPGIVVGTRYTAVNKDTVSSRNILSGPIRGTSTNQAAPPSHQSPKIWMSAQQGLSSNLPSSDKHKLFLVFSQSHVW